MSTTPTTPDDLLVARAVETCLLALAEGGMVVVTDDHDREDEGDLVVAAELVTEQQMAFLVRHTTGIVCAPMTEDRADVLDLPLMVQDATDPLGTAFTVTVDAAGTGTGVSAQDRVMTVAALADLDTRPDELRRPGHVFPLRARAGGVLARPGHTEAAVDLTLLAGLSGVGVIGEIVADDGGMRRGIDLLTFAAEHDLPVLAISELVRYRRTREQLVTRVSESSLPTRAGDFRALAYRAADGLEHLALVLGDVESDAAQDEGVLVRLHSECLTGDVLGSLRCDCGDQLDASLRAVAEAGRGVVVYLRGHEGRGIGLAGKVHAYALQEAGLDTVDANTAQGLPVDARSYDVGAAVLLELEVRRVRLLTGNPAKGECLVRHGLDVVEQVPLETVPTEHNLGYLRTKVQRLGHDPRILSDSAAVPAAVG